MADAKLIKWLVIINGAVPLALLGYDAWRGTLGVNAVNYAIRTTGLISLIFLLLSLCITPLRKLTGWSWLILARRGLGLYAFVYAAVHFSIYFIWDRELSLSSTLSEMVKRQYLIVGSIGLALMTPLALTSTNAMVRRLGVKRWQRLHRAAYYAAIAGAIHYYWLIKADKRQPTAFAAVLGVLLLYRLIAHYFGLRRAAANATKVPVIARPRFWRGKLRVARIFQETPTIRTFRFLPIAGDELPFRALPGQYLNVMLPIGGKQVARSYTISSAPTRTAYCEITVKRETQGRASRHLHDALQEGDEVSVSAPAGKFTFTGKESQSAVLIAGGVGITPCMSIVRALTDHCWPGKIDLFYGAISENEFAFAAELNRLAERFANLKLHLTCSRDASPNWTGLRGRLSAATIRERASDFARSLFYVCGPAAMQENITAGLIDLGVPTDRIRTEAFTSPTASTGSDETVSDAMPATTDGEAMYDIHFARSGKHAAGNTDTPILESAEAIGLELPFDCRSGICGQCKLKLRSGDVRMPVQDALTAEDRAAGVVLACQAFPQSDVVVDA